MIESIISYVLIIGVLLMLFIGMVVHILSSVNGLRSRDVLALLAMAVRYELPLPELLQAQAREIRWKRGERLDELADLLKQGASLPAALATIHDLLTPQSALAVRVGGECGLLKESLESEMQDRQQQVQHRDFAYYYNYTYFSLVVLLVLLITLFINHAIRHRLASIYNVFSVDDINTPFMKLFSFYNQIDQPVLHYAIAFTIPVLLVFALMILLRDTLNYIIKIHFLRALIAPFWLMIEFMMGWTRRLVVRRANGHILRYLALAAENARPLEEIVDSLSRHYPDEDIRKRLHRVRTGLEGGEGLWNLLARQKFLTSAETATLLAAEGNQQLVPTLRELSQEQASRRGYRIGLSLEWGRFVLVLLLSGWATFLALLVWGPLMELISSQALSSPM